jgi:hypothetical protein
MKNHGMAVLLLPALLLFFSGCVAEPGMDKTKFAELNRTAEELKSAITSSSPCDLSATLQQRLASGIVAVQGTAASREEHDLIAAYSHLLATYQDGLLLCRSRAQLTNFTFFPKGRIYVSQELDPLVERYDLPLERHLYRLTGQHVKSIDGNSIQVIWASALAQIRNIENMVRYN